MRYDIYHLSRKFCNVLTKHIKEENEINFSRTVVGNLTEGTAFCFGKKSAVHAAVASSYSQDTTEDFLPLTVDYRDRAYAHGRIPVRPDRRERHGSNEEILVARIIDRAIRPLFPKGYTNEVTITTTAHAADGEFDPTILAVNAASCALMLSRQPWNGPIGCVRIGQIDGKLCVNPSVNDMKNSKLDLVYAGTSTNAVMYVL